MKISYNISKSKNLIDLVPIRQKKKKKNKLLQILFTKF